MKKIFKVLGVIASIAIPFVAPAIAGAIAGSSALAGTAFGTFMAGAGGSALTGAVLGGATAALAGGNPLLGAVLGGVGGYAGGGGTLFGGAPAASGAPTTAPRPLPRPAGLGITPAATTTVATAPTTLGSFFSQVGQGLLDNPAGVAQLAITVFGRPPQNLTAAEQAQLEELKGLAATNKQLFEQRVSEANALLQQARQQAPNPQQAFAETKIATERQLAEQTRGLGANEAAFAARRAGIRSSQTGATAAAAEVARGTQAQTQLTQAGLGLLPTSAPTGYAGMALPTYEALQQRRDAYRRDLASATGDLFGSAS